MLRLAVTGGGCSGFQYNFALDDARMDDDLVIERDGAMVLIDPVSLDFLKGSEIDFVDDLIGAGFQGQQSQRDLLLRLRHELLGLMRPVKLATWNVNSVNARLDTRRRTG